jgi:hypothetical protein
MRQPRASPPATVKYQPRKKNCEISQKSLDRCEQRSYGAHRAVMLLAAVMRNASSKTRKHFNYLKAYIDP